MLPLLIFPLLPKTQLRRTLVRRQAAADKPEAVADAVAGGVVVVAVRDLAEVGRAGPGAAAQHAVAARRGALGVQALVLGVVVGLVPVPAPFPDVAAHVVEAQGVGLALTDGLEAVAGGVLALGGGVVLEPHEVFHLAALVDAGPLGAGAGASARGVFPFGLGGQAVAVGAPVAGLLGARAAVAGTQALALAEPVGVGAGAVPAHQHHRMVLEAAFHHERVLALADAAALAQAAAVEVDPGASALGLVAFGVQKFHELGIRNLVLSDEKVRDSDSVQRFFVN